MGSDWVLVVVSIDSGRSDWVRAEVKAAMADHRFRDRILPLAVDGSSAAPINPDLAGLQTIDGRAVEDLGERIGDFLLDRERKARSKAVVDISG
jgi:hypothetical protein